MMRPSNIYAAAVRRAGVVMSLAVVMSVFSSGATAQSRLVFVNGQYMSDRQVAALARRACADIPDGAYWLNLQTGAWGYAGSPQVQGTLGDACGGGGHPGVNSRYGPYATMRRAEEVANGFRAQGLRAVAFHNGDGYYVNVKR
jgi:hypothetical protein